MSGGKQLVTMSSGVHKWEACVLQQRLHVVAHKKTSADHKGF
jgi:hypothetical protein